MIERNGTNAAGTVQYNIACDITYQGFYLLTIPLKEIPPVILIFLIRINVSTKGCRQEVLSKFYYIVGKSCFSHNDHREKSDTSHETLVTSFGEILYYSQHRTFSNLVKKELNILRAHSAVQRVNWTTPLVLLADIL